MCSANKQELCSVAGFTNEDPEKVPPYDVGRFLLIEDCDRHNRSRRVWIQWVVGGTAINVQRKIVAIEKK
jgi:hypothetical protein